jgi:hypothetical protein
MDDWQYLERQVVRDPQGRSWSVALMDVLGQDTDPDLPSAVREQQYGAARYHTLIYSSGGAIQWERSHTTLTEATHAYEQLLLSVVDGRLDPAQPVFRQDLED